LEDEGLEASAEVPMSEYPFYVFKAEKMKPIVVAVLLKAEIEVDT